MAIGTTTTLSDSIRVQYVEDYIKGARFQRLYDAYAQYPIGKPQSELIRGSSVSIPLLYDLEPVTGTISQVYDVTPVTFADGTVSITPTSRINAIQDSETLLIQAYTDYGASRFELLGKNMQESVDLVAQGVCLQGGNVYRGAARASLNSGANECSNTSFEDVTGDFMTAHAPSWETVRGDEWIATMHPYVYSDLRTGGQLVYVAEYQKGEIITNMEMASLGRFRLAVSPWAKVFWSAGLANASAIATTLSAAAAQGAVTITVAANTNIDVGDQITIGTLETGDTHYADNEHVKVISVSGTTVGVAGSGPGGGLRFSHASGETVSNADNVGTVVFGGPRSIGKVYATEVGEFGQVVGPKYQGLVEQFVSLGWKWYGGYGRISESWLMRGEFSIGRDS